MYLLAHAGEQHENVVETTQHAFEIDPVISSTLTLILAILLPFIAFRVTKSHTTAVSVFLFELLVIGLFTYSFQPTISALAIVIGFFASLFLVLGTLR